jgi:hypothetical protein
VVSLRQAQALEIIPHKRVVLQFKRLGKRQPAEELTGLSAKQGKSILIFRKRSMGIVVVITHPDSPAEISNYRQTSLPAVRPKPELPA